MIMSNSLKTTTVSFDTTVDSIYDTFPAITIVPDHTRNAANNKTINDVNSFDMSGFTSPVPKKSSTLIENSLNAILTIMSLSVVALFFI